MSKSSAIISIRINDTLGVSVDDDFKIYIDTFEFWFVKHEDIDGGMYWAANSFNDVITQSENPKEQIPVYDKISYSGLFPDSVVINSKILEESITIYTPHSNLLPINITSDSLALFDSSLITWETSGTGSAGNFNLCLGFWSDKPPNYGDYEFEIEPINQQFYVPDTIMTELRKIGRDASIVIENTVDNPLTDYFASNSRYLFNWSVYLPFD